MRLWQTNNYVIKVSLVLNVLVHSFCSCLFLLCPSSFPDHSWFIPTPFLIWNKDIRLMTSHYLYLSNSTEHSTGNSWEQQFTFSRVTLCHAGLDENLLKSPPSTNFHHHHSPLCNASALHNPSAYSLQSLFFHAIFIICHACTPVTILLQLISDTNATTEGNFFKYWFSEP